jgi:hypothetical protein
MEAMGPAGGQAPELTVRRFRVLSPGTASALGLLVLVLAAATLTLTGFDHQLTIRDTAVGVAIVLIYAGVGLIVARRQPRNPIGWLLLIFTVLYVLGAGASYYAVLRYRLGHRGLPLAPVALVLDTMQAPSLAVPAGHLAVPGWPADVAPLEVGGLGLRGVIAYVTAVTVAPAVGAVASHDIRLNIKGNLTNSGQLGGWLANPPPWLVVLVFGSIVVIGLSFVAHQVLSWRRAVGERRQQLKWLASGAAIAVFSILLAALIGSPFLLVGLVALPAGIGVGILKYRLYDIDRIISRTLAYAIITGLLIGVYAALVLLATQVFRVHTPVAVAAATLAAAALFAPVRRRVQQAVDRRFNRARYDADQTVAAFAARLQDAVNLDSARADLASVVTQALEPAHVSVWINERG